MEDFRINRPVWVLTKTVKRRLSPRTDHMVVRVFGFLPSTDDLIECGFAPRVAGILKTEGMFEDSVEKYQLQPHFVC